MNDTAQLNQTAEMHGSNQHLAQQSAAPLVSIIIPCHNQARFLFLSDAIASVLGLSERTVQNHCEAIFIKLGIRSRWQISAELRRASESRLDP